MTSNRVPLAYLITFHTYGTWLHGDEAGSVDWTHNRYDTPTLPPEPRLEAHEHAAMHQTPYVLNSSRRLVVLKTIQEVCTHRAWTLLAGHVRTNHVHVVVQAQAAPEKIMNDFKAYSSRRLTQAGFENREHRRWSRHGSTRYLWETQHVQEAVQYVVHEQGEPMAVYNSTILP